MTIRYKLLILAGFSDTVSSELNQVLETTGITKVRYKFYYRYDTDYAILKINTNVGRIIKKINLYGSEFEKLTALKSLKTQIFTFNCPTLKQDLYVTY